MTCKYSSSSRTMRLFFRSGVALTVERSSITVWPFWYTILGWQYTQRGINCLPYQYLTKELYWQDLQQNYGVFVGTSAQRSLWGILLGLQKKEKNATRYHFRPVRRASAVRWCSCVKRVQIAGHEKTLFFWSPPCFIVEDLDIISDFCAFRALCRHTTWQRWRAVTHALMDALRSSIRTVSFCSKVASSSSTSVPNHFYLTLSSNIKSCRYSSLHISQSTAVSLRTNPTKSLEAFHAYC